MTRRRSVLAAPPSAASAPTPARSPATSAARPWYGRSSAAIAFGFVSLSATIVTAEIDRGNVTRAMFASDTATTLDVIAHARQACPGFDVLLVLQPTSPLRRAADIDAAFAQMMASGAQSCTSVCEADTPPWLMYRQTETGFVESVLPPWPGGMRRQDLPPVYVLNGALYFVKTTAFDATGQLLPKPTAGYVMPVQTSIDIDTPEDLLRAEAALAADRPQD